MTVSQPTTYGASPARAGLHRSKSRTDRNTAKKIELLWIDRLMSEYPQGLNYTRYDNVKSYK